MRIIYYGQDPLPDFKNPVLTVGTFDGLHLAHKKIISQLCQSAASIGGESILISFYPHPRTVLDPGDQPVALLNTLDEKIQILNSTTLDYLILIAFEYSFAQMVPEDYIENFLVKYFRPKKIIAGYDHRFGKDGKGDCELLRYYASKNYFEFDEIKAQYVEESKLSSTKIRSLIQEKKIHQANLYLGYPYQLEGKVIPGDKLGRKIGYPTANLEFTDQSKLIPPDGIYAVKILVDGLLFNGMLYIGKSETLKESSTQSVEVHLFDFNKEIYGTTVLVKIIDFVRNDVKFDSLESLKNQIHSDEKACKKALIRNELHTLPFRKPIYAIVILNFNGYKFLKEYLPSVTKHNQHNLPIYVIDNNSTDSSCVFLEHHFPEIKIIRLRKNYGFASGYNKGLAQIDADYFILLNSDVLIKNDWISPLISEIQKDPTVLIAQPKILSLNEPDKFEYAGAAGGYIDLLGYPFCKGRMIDYLETDKGQYQDITEIFWASGAAMLIKAVAFKSLGGFDGDYFAHQEEIDLCWRIKRLGGKIIYVPDSVIFHLGGGTLDYDNPRKTYLNFRNNLFTLFKNTGYLQLLYILPIRFILDLLIAISYLFKGKLNIFYKIIQAYIVAIINTLYLIQKKKYSDKQINDLAYSKFNQKGILKASIFIQFYFSGNKVFSQIPKNYFKD
ncbi:MAG: bifunctional riboflavin kinase/FAD synthetase [Saprospiraceae bacterium]|nr:bifunctional riboflavin kinase/FAD synthetase [Saprospiraceae bacterium]